MKAKGRRAVLVLGVALALSGAGNAEAVFVASLCNDAVCAGAGDIIVADQGVGDTNPVVGVIVAQGVVGGLTTSVNIAQSKPVLGSAGAPEMDLGFVATGIGEVWLFASDTGFTGITPFRLQVGGVSTGSPISVEASAGGGSANTNQTPGAPTFASLGPFSGSPFTGETLSGVVGNAVNPYSLTLGVHAVQNGGTSTGDTSLIAQPTTVPEPTSLLVMALGLFGLGMLIRRRAG
jgi:hypothetical protein